MCETLQLFIPSLSSSPFSYRALILLKVAIYSAKLLHFLVSATSEMKDLSERHWVGLSRELFYLSLFLPLLLIAINNVFLMSELQQPPLELEHKAMLSKEQPQKGVEPPCSPWVLTSQASCSWKIRSEIIWATRVRSLLVGIQHNF